MTGIERFDSKVTPEPMSGCWLWTASMHHGYGQFSVKHRPIDAHRFAYETLVGPIPADREIDHLCRNRACCNPAHLEAVTARTNTLRGVGATAKHARQTHCLRGHPFDESNTTRASGGGRACRQCDKDRSKRRWANERR